MDRETAGSTRRGRGLVSSLVTGAMTLTCMAQLRHLEVGANGGLVWNLPLGLVLACLTVMNVAVWLLARETRRSGERMAALEGRP